MTTPSHYNVISYILDGLFNWNWNVEFVGRNRLFTLRLSLMPDRNSYALARINYENGQLL